MRSFFTSPLDKIAPPSPYVNAMNWDAYRSKFRSDRSGKSGNRSCAMALCSLNPESSELSITANRGQDIPLIVQNTLNSRFSIEVHSEPHSLSALDVDACFGSTGLEFLAEKPVSEFGPSVTDESVWSIENTFDLELGLLECVQEIALTLARTPPKRTHLTKEAADLNSDAADRRSWMG